MFFQSYKDTNIINNQNIQNPQEAALIGAWSMVLKWDKFRKHEPAKFSAVNHAMTSHGWHQRKAPSSALTVKFAVNLACFSLSAL